MSLVTVRTPGAVVPRPRRIAAPSWLDIRLWSGLALVLASVLVGASVLAAARQTSPAVAVRRDLAVGTVLAADDLTVVQVRLPDNAPYPRTLAEVVGQQLSRPVAAGELVPAAALGSPAARTTIAVPLEAAAAPALRRGDRIELWLSVGACAATVLLPAVTVQSARVDSGAFGSGTGGQDVIISVAPELAERVVTALAFDDVRLRAGVLTGPTVAGDPAAPLPDLRECTPVER